MRLTAIHFLLGYGVVGAAVATRTLRLWKGDPTARPRLTGHNLAVLGVLTATLITRFLATRDLALPAWVDSPHHALIAGVLAEAGHVPRSYQPVLAVDEFTYHFGFHALAVTFHWLTTLTLPETFLWLGDCLNGLMALAGYAFTRELTGRSRAALVAAFVVGVVSLFPGYYLAWGRYTQLTGLIILAPLLTATWQLVRPTPGIFLRAEVTGLIVLVALLASGLLFAHYRVAFFYATFAWVALACGRTGGWRRIALAGVATLALAGPWLWQLSEKWLTVAFEMPGTLASPSGYNDFPLAYFESDLERAWITSAILGLGLMLLRRKRLAGLMIGWLAFTSALLNLGPGSWVVNNNSWAISLFLPGALLVGWGVDALSVFATRWWIADSSARRAVGLLCGGALSAALTAGALFGVRAQLTMANPTTTLALADDVPALEWISVHTPTDAVIAANSWLWQNGAWAGSDGGAWIVPLTQRRSTIPPVDYGFDGALATRVSDFNERLSQVTDANAPETLALLREAGVTHVFIGARGGTLKPEMFVNSPHYALLFTNGAAWIFEVAAHAEP
jgi:hypothetical protein